MNAPPVPAAMDSVMCPSAQVPISIPCTEEQNGHLEKVWGVPFISLRTIWSRVAHSVQIFLLQQGCWVQ